MCLFSLFRLFGELEGVGGSIRLSIEALLLVFLFGHCFFFAVTGFYWVPHEWRDNLSLCVLFFFFFHGCFDQYSLGAIAIDVLNDFYLFSLSF